MLERVSLLVKQTFASLNWETCYAFLPPIVKHCWLFSGLSGQICKSLAFPTLRHLNFPFRTLISRTERPLTGELERERECSRTCVCTHVRVGNLRTLGPSTCPPSNRHLLSSAQLKSPLSCPYVAGSLPCLLLSVCAPGVAGWSQKCCFIHTLGNSGGNKDCSRFFFFFLSDPHPTAWALATPPSRQPLPLPEKDLGDRGPVVGIGSLPNNTEFIWRASGKPGSLYFPWLRNRVPIRAGSFGRDTRSSAGRRRMLAAAAQSSLAHSRMASSPVRWPSWLSECLQEKSAGRGLCYAQEPDSSPPKKTCSFLKG